MAEALNDLYAGVVQLYSAMIIAQKNLTFTLSSFCTAVVICFVYIYAT